MKNYKGWIYGDETQKYWTQTFNRRTKNRFYSPIDQNIGHIKALNNLLQLDEDIYESVIVFSNKSRMKLEVPYNVIKLKHVKKHFNIYCDDENIINGEQVEKIKQLLSTKVNVDPKIKKQHIKEIESFKKINYKEIII